MSEQDDAYQRAKTRVEQIRAWFILMAIYVVMTPVLFFIDLVTGGGVEFAHWAVLGFASAAVIHTLVVWGGPFGQKWEDRKIREIMERERSDAASSGQADTPERP